MADGGDSRVHDLTPQDVARGLADGPRAAGGRARALTRSRLERYPQAVVLPLSSFDPAAIPDPQGRQVRVRLPLGPALDHRFARCAGAGLCL